MRRNTKQLTSSENIYTKSSPLQIIPTVEKCTNTLTWMESNACKNSTWWVTNRTVFFSPPTEVWQSEKLKLPRDVCCFYIKKTRGWMRINGTGRVIKKKDICMLIQTHEHGDGASRHCDPPGSPSASASASASVCSYQALHLPTRPPGLSRAYSVSRAVPQGDLARLGQPRYGHGPKWATTKQ